MFLNPALAECRERANGARGARELSEVAGAEQHSRVPAAPSLVDVDELRPEIGQLVDALDFEIGQARRRALQGLLRLVHHRFGLLELLDFDVPIDFALPQVPHQASGFFCEPFRLSL